MSQPTTGAIDALIDTLVERLADAEALAFDGHAQASLNNEAGLALLYAELGHVDPRYRRVAHHYLTVANQTLTGHERHALFDGVPALAFAASSAVQHDGEYANLLTGVDETVFRAVRVVLAEERQRLRAGAVAEHYMNFDLISGLTGLGRYLLRRAQRVDEAEELLREVCGYLTELVRPVEHEGVRVPGWWARNDLNPYAPDPAGHANLGMAHGIAGPLALLSTTWRHGIHVEGHAETIQTIADFLIEWSDVDEHGRYWPSALHLDDYRHRPGKLARSRVAWCYGNPGVARAIQLAGFALERGDLVNLARAAALDMFSAPQQQWRVQDTCLCHGWAGLLHVLSRIDADDPACTLGERLDWLAERTAAEFNPDLPVGYQQLTGLHLEPRDDPGFLTGSAGVVLALHAYRTGTRPATGWDAALLLD